MADFVSSSRLVLSTPLLPRLSSRNRNNILLTAALRFRGKAMAASSPRVNAEAVRATSVPVRVAHELLLAGHRYLDVRTPEEFRAGHASGAINVPYMVRVASGLSKNPDFVQQVSAHFRKYDEIIVGCKIGKRSLMATTDLLAAGFTGVTDIAGGYDAWKQNGLPTQH
ncbi:PREDICTED: thiosulfate sulfurtransferase 16, chloroplastic [Tarenaya hassleriana]|uniref:thiosulfate sulfurtransferase 16, chloroplastic n=1 Tax=Tarenaya hassleriana TaxID=28532 RepID=UPI00053C986A|nr:PREDICTED: thiosulfate sulfurtransferase 16, chloroplastic [Tarenaya hassleriana]